MKDELKEILEDIDNKECYYVGTNGCLYQDLTEEQLLLIKNYITNLQQYYNDNVNKYEELIEKYSKLRTRFDKAIEKLESVRIYGLRSGKTLIFALINGVLDILKGESDD